MPRLLIVGEHPTLHRGFAVVGRNIAECLAANENWEIDYLGRMEPADGFTEFPFRVFDVDPLGEFSGELLLSTLERLLNEVETTSPTLLLSIGTGDDHLLLVDLLQRHQLRNQVYLMAYLPIDYAPLPPLFGQLYASADLLIPYTNYAYRIMQTWCSNANASLNKIADPIPHGVCTDVFRPSTSDVRCATRREVFGLDDTSFLVGYFGRNSRHKRSELAMRILHLFAAGQYTRCCGCQHLEAFSMNPIDMTFAPVGHCSNCHSHRIESGQALPTARLYMHTDLPSRNARQVAGGWDLELLAHRLGITRQIIWNRDLRIGFGVSMAELARRMSACDVHLLPHEAGGWELTVLETGACGVANIITDFAAPPEYAAPFSRLIPVGTHVFEPTGVRGLMDINAAVKALVELAANPYERRVLGENGIQTAQNFAWPKIAKRWHALLARLLSCDMHMKPCDWERIKR